MYKQRIKVEANFENKRLFIIEVLIRISVRIVCQTDTENTLIQLGNSKILYRQNNNPLLGFHPAQLKIPNLFPAN